MNVTLNDTPAAALSGWTRVERNTAPHATALLPFAIPAVLLGVLVAGLAAHAALIALLAAWKPLALVAGLGLALWALLPYLLTVLAVAALIFGASSKRRKLSPSINWRKIRKHLWSRVPVIGPWLH